MKWDIDPPREEIAFLMESGFVYREAQRFQEAEEVFRGVRALLPKSEVPEVALGTLYFEQGKMKEAQKHYQRALQLNPRSAYALAHLGEVNLAQRDMAAARESLKKAVDLDPRGEFGDLARNLLQLSETIADK